MWLSLRPIWFILGVILVSCASMYWIHDHAYLASFFERVNPTFYRADQFHDSWFTPSVKSMGNIWFLLAIICWLGSIPLIPHWKFDLKSLSFSFTRGDGVICGFGVLFMYVLSKKIPYSYDEVFSAVHFAAKTCFLTCSYYPLPNNHIFYNLLNGLLGKITSDFLLSGRLLSGIATLLLLLSIFRFFKHLCLESIFIFASMAVIATQFSLMAFSMQARGYALLVLFSWWSFVTYYNYQTNQTTKDLVLHSICNVIGMWIMPSYMYLWFAYCLILLINIFNHKKIDVIYLTSFFVTATCILIAYLPVLIFSGVSSLTFNRYVISPEMSNLSFIQDLWSGNYFSGLFRQWFLFTGPSWLGWLLVFFPMILLSIVGSNVKSSSNFPKNVGWYYAAYWLSFIVIVIFMRKMPFYRNLIFFELITVVMIILSIYRLTMIINKPFISKAFVAIFVIYSFTAWWTNIRLFPDSIYYYDHQATYNRHKESPIYLPSFSSILVEDDCFYWQSFIYGDNIKIDHGKDIQKNHGRSHQLMLESDSTKINILLWKRVSRHCNCVLWAKNTDIKK